MTSGIEVGRVHTHVYSYATDGTTDILLLTSKTAMDLMDSDIDRILDWFEEYVVELRAFYPEGMRRVVLTGWTGSNWETFMRWGAGRATERRRVDFFRRVR